jgi:hypothetical protein
MNRNIAKTVLSLVAIIAFNSAGNVNAADNCDLKEIQKTDKSVKDLICDKELGNFYLKYSPGKQQTWIVNPKNGMELVLDSFGEGENPEFVGTDTHIKFVAPKIIRQAGKKFIGAVFAHRSRCNDDEGACNSGSEEYFVSIEIRKHTLVKRKQLLIESCFGPYMLDDNNDEKNLIFLGVLDGNEIVFNWTQYGFEHIRKGVTGRFNFLSNKLKITERPESESELDEK